MLAQGSDSTGRCCVRCLRGFLPGGPLAAPTKCNCASFARLRGGLFWVSLVQDASNRRPRSERRGRKTLRVLHIRSEQGADIRGTAPHLRSSTYGCRPLFSVFPNYSAIKTYRPTLLYCPYTAASAQSGALSASSVSLAPYCTLMTTALLLLPSTVSTTFTLPRPAKLDGMRMFA